MSKPHIADRTRPNTAHRRAVAGQLGSVPRSRRASGRVAGHSERRNAARASRRVPRLSTPRSIPSTTAKACLLHPAKEAEARVRSGERAVCRSSPTVDGTKPQEATRDPVADNLLAEILPNPQPKPSEAHQRALPGPRTTGQGLIPGSGAGGGGGLGGGSGGRCRPQHRTGHPVLWRTRPRPLLRLRDRLLRQHGHPKLARCRET